VREHLLYIGGQWRHGSGGVLDAVSPATSEVFARTAAGGADDVDAAVAAGAAAFPAWAAASAFERAAACSRVADAVGAHRDRLADVLACIDEPVGVAPAVRRAGRQHQRARARAGRRGEPSGGVY
jgi:aldehyde dehydrogenase (NAD+)